MMYGYAGTILRVDLTNALIKKDPLPQEMAERFLGGRGFVAKLLWDEMPKNADPLGEENMIVIATGPLTANFVPANGKTHFGTKSPASGGWADSNMGGHFAPQIKYAGYDVIVLTGKAEEPSYLYIEDDKVEIRSAASYWGKGAIETETMMKTDLGEDFEICTIGPAGEKKVRFACISHDFGRQAGRTGVGAVLGSKNIKAIAVKGTGTVPVFDPEGLYQKGKEAYKSLFTKPGFKGWTPQGTAGITDWVNIVGAFPTKNFSENYFEKYQQINGEAVINKLKITDKGCSLCPTPCGKYGFAKTKSGSAFVEGPEYESIALLGGNLLLETIEEVGYANYVCDELGLDTISAGGVAAWVMECFEKGILTKEDLGREVKFGDLDSALYLFNLMTERKGIGDLLAEGVKAASEKVGQGSEKFAIHCKGLEWTGYECRNLPGMMLSYMTADVGAHHNRAWVCGYDVVGDKVGTVHDLIAGGGAANKRPKSAVQGKSQKVIELQHKRPMFDVLGVCRLQWVEIGFDVENYEELLYLITGRKMAWDQMLEVSERVWHFTRAFSVREIHGFGRKWDIPPARFYEEPSPSGPNEGLLITREEMDILLDEYYQARGWDKNGIPTKETLEKVGLEDIAEVVESIRTAF